MGDSSDLEITEDDESSDDLVARKESSTKVSSSSDDSNSKVQFMVTKKMRKTLIEELGYLESEIDMIEPQIAAVVIERGLSRPSSGMPASWKKTNISKVSRVRKHNKNIFSGLFKSLGTIIRAIFNKTKFIGAIAIITVLLVKNDPINFKDLKLTNGIPNFKNPASKNKNPSINLSSLESMQGYSWLDKLR